MTWSARGLVAPEDKPFSRTGLGREARPRRPAAMAGGRRSMAHTIGRGALAVTGYQALAPRLSGLRTGKFRPSQEGPQMRGFEGRAKRYRSGWRGACGSVLDHLPQPLRRRPRIGLVCPRGLDVEHSDVGGDAERERHAGLPASTPVRLILALGLGIVLQDRKLGSSRTSVRRRHRGRPMDAERGSLLAAPGACSPGATPPAVASGAGASICVDDGSILPRAPNGPQWGPRIGLRAHRSSC
jgi:hypothetical protein